MKKIVFVVIPLLMTLFAFGPVNSFTVHGVVKDDHGQIIPYVTVTEKGTRNSVSADATGTFTIRVKTEKAVLVISAVGYAVKEIKLRGRSNINIALNTTESHLEVKVSGYANADASANHKISITAGLGMFSAPYAKYKSPYDYNGHNGRYDSSIRDFNTEEYDKITENPFLKVTDNPLSTFSIDVDAASYSNVRRFLNSGDYLLPVPFVLKK